MSEVTLTPITTDTVVAALRDDLDAARAEISKLSRKLEQKRNRQPGRPGYLADPRQTRPGEVIGGGHFVFRRTSGTGRIRAPEWPYEHPTREAAETERARLAALFPEERFVVISEARP